VVPLDNELTKVATEDEMSEWESLSERQQEMAEDTAEIVLKFGMFNQGSGADGAHYFDGSKNPFKAEGVMCKNCIFFNEEANQCVVVEGNIDEEGLCKLWVIPEDELGETPEQETQEDAMEYETEKAFWCGTFDPRSVNKIG
jgi:hypothetical protein